MSNEITKLKERVAELEGNLSTHAFANIQNYAKRLEAVCSSAQLEKASNGAALQLTEYLLREDRDQLKERVTELETGWDKCIQDFELQLDCTEAARERAEMAECERNDLQERVTELEGLLCPHRLSRCCDCMEVAKAPSTDPMEDIHQFMALCDKKRAALKEAVDYALRNYRGMWNASHFERLCIDAGVYPCRGSKLEECLRLESVLRYVLSCHSYNIDGSTLYDLYEGKEDKRS